MQVISVAVRRVVDGQRGARRAAELATAGAAFQGIGVPCCVAQGRAAAARVAKALSGGVPGPAEANEAAAPWQVSSDPAAAEAASELGGCIRGAASCLAGIDFTEKAAAIRAARSDPYPSEGVHGHDCRSHLRAQLLPGAGTR